MATESDFSRNVELYKPSLGSLALPSALLSLSFVGVAIAFFRIVKRDTLSYNETVDLINLFFILISASGLSFCLIIREYIARIRSLICEMKTVNDELNEQRNRSLQTSKMSALGEMVGGIAHEINTPLATVKVFLGEAIAELEKGESQDDLALADYLHKSDATVDRIAKIIKGLKTFARSGELDPHQKFSVQECIEDAMILCGDRFKNESVEILWEIPASTIMIECRPVEITQVLINLLNNSLDAVRTLSEKWVRLEVDHTPDFVQIRVTDSGTGIPPEALEKIFQPFFTTKEIGKGTGIGLSISVGIVRSHNGRLFVDPGHLNTSFVIEIPKQQGLAIEISDLKGTA